MSLSCPRQTRERGAARFLLSSVSQQAPLRLSAGLCQGRDSNIRNQIYYKIYIFVTTNLNLRKPLPLQNEMQKINFKTNNRPQMLSFFFYFSCCSWKCEIEPLYEGSSAGWSTNKNAGKSIQSPQFFRSNLNFLPCKIIVDRSKSLTGHFLDQSSEDLNCPDLDCKDTSAPFWHKESSMYFLMQFNPDTN